jgi:hypothetical protein
MFHQPPIKLCLVILTLLTTISADCTNWTNTRWQTDGPNGYSTLNSISLESVACPSANKSGCMIPRKSYTVTIPRSLNISASAADTENIFALARTSKTGPNFTIPAFEDRKVTVSTFSIDSLFIEIEPGQNKTLLYLPYTMTSWGTLGGCTNKSLNGVGVLAMAAFVNSSNMTDGTWGASSDKIMGNGNAAVRLNGGGVSSVLLVYGLAVLVSLAL